MLELGDGACADPAALRRELVRLQRRFGEVPVGQVAVTEVLRESTALARRHGLRLPGPLALVLKALVTLEGLVRQLDPDTSLVAVAAPLARELLRERLTPARVGPAAARTALETGRALLRLPRQASLVLTLLEEGGVRLAVRHQGLEQVAGLIDRALSRLALAVLAGSLILGAAQMAERAPAAAYVFAGAVLASLWLILWIIGLLGRP